MAVNRTRILTGVAVTLLCGAATAAAGPLWFVGLIVPHAVRAVVGPDQRWVLPYLALAAPVPLLGADVVGRLIARPGEVQVGIVWAGDRRADLHHAGQAEAGGGAVNDRLGSRPGRPEGEAGGGAVNVRVGPWSVRLAPRALLVTPLLVVAGFCVTVAALSTGEFTVPVPDILDALFGQGTPVAELIVGKLRAPRVVTGLLVGAAFGISGAIFQSPTRNPLGSPDFIGFTAGASTGGIIAVVSGGSAAMIAGGALTGCVVTAVLVYALAYRGGVQGYRLVLVGIGANALLVALNLVPADQGQHQRRRHGGSLAHRQPQRARLGPRPPGRAGAARAAAGVRARLPADAHDRDGRRRGQGHGHQGRGRPRGGADGRRAAVRGGHGRRRASSSSSPWPRRSSPGGSPARRGDHGGLRAHGRRAADRRRPGAQRLLAPTQLPVGVLTAAIGGTYSRPAPAKGPPLMATSARLSGTGLTLAYDRADRGQLAWT